MSSAPTVGRIVHYRSYGTPGGEYVGECRAAVVTETAEQAYHSPPGFEDTVGLCVLSPTGQHFDRAVHHDEAKAGGTWHWPCVITKEQA